MGGDATARAGQLACTLTNLMIRLVRTRGGDDAVDELLARAGVDLTPAYLEDVTNWIDHADALALFEAIEEMTGDPAIGRRIGEEAVRQHAGTAIATLLRSLGSPEAILEQVAVTVTKFSTISEMEAVESGPGRAVVRAWAREGFARSHYLCDWTSGLLSQAPALFGLPPASVEESECQARGGKQCLYSVTWDAEMAATAADPKEQVTALESQLKAMGERLESVYATAGDLISHDDVESALARITERAATAVRAPRYLLAVRHGPEATLHFHHRGFDEHEALELAHVLANEAQPDLGESGLVADVVSRRHRYGRLLAVYPDAGRFFAQERALFQIYARYAAAVLDTATALDDARRRNEEARALLELSQTLAAAGTSQEVAQRLVEAVPSVVDCDRLAVLAWDEEQQVLVCSAATAESPEALELILSTRIAPADTPLLAKLLDAPESQPLFFTPDTDDVLVAKIMRTFGSSALAVVPIVARGTLLGGLTVAVGDRPERLRPTRDLLDRLAGVTGQAATALENGRLVDQITRLAHQDDLTGLPNRRGFGDRIEQALAYARTSGSRVGLFFVDLDGFKQVNDARGHAAGDELLYLVAERLLGVVRSGDTVARLSGDEFAIVLSGVTGDDEVGAAARRVQSAFDAPFEIGGELVEVRASVGHAVWPDDAPDAEALMRRADAEMYRAKRGAGRAR